MPTNLDLTPPDREWDEWVVSMPGGHHLQTTAWADVKAAAGWRARRVVLRDGSDPVAGCQILLRTLALGRSAAYVPRGPLFATRDEALLDELLTAVRRVVRDEHVTFLKLQPPVDRDDMPALLARRGFVASELQTAPAASVRIDVGGHRSEDEIFAAMRTTARRRVRQALKQGVAVRTGTAEDLPILQALLEATARRQGFAPYPVEYYRRLWDAFSPGGNVRILFAEHQGRPLAGCLLIPFGDTVIYKIGAWGGDKQSPQGAAVLMHWTAIRWAHESGYHWYDLEGIPPEVARSALAGDRAKPEDGVAYFKLGFGGEPVLYPATYDRAFGPLVGPALGSLMRSRRGRKVVHHLSGRRA